MTINEKKWFAGSLGIIVLSSLFLISVYTLKHRIEIPTSGGNYTEALIGSPRFINPLYAPTNDADADLTRLLYSGLVKWKPTEGYVNDLADSMNVNADQTQYTFHIRPNATFSNGEPVQARDVVFTYSAIQNPEYRSPLISYFKNVKIEQVNDQTVSFTLSEASPTFSKRLTVGILPENLWSDVLPQNAPLASLNLQPVGSGPYIFSEFSKDKKGSIRSYTLKRNNHYYNQPAKIDELIFKFYSDEESASQALVNKNVEGVGYVAFEHRSTALNNHNVNAVFATIPRSTNLFFNPQNAILKNPAVRLAIAKAIDKNSIIKTILDSHATVLNGPIMIGSTGYDASFTANEFDPANAITTLESAGYVKPEGSTWRIIPVAPAITPKTSNKKNKKKTEAPVAPVVPVQPPSNVSFTLTTVSNDEFSKVAEEIKNELEKIGIQITIKTVAADHLMSDVVNPQTYDLLLAAEFAGADDDPYLYWHSSEIKTDERNIIHYQNKDVDSLLEKAHTTPNETDRSTIYRQFQNLMIKDAPAVFLYQSTYTYAIGKKVHFTAPNFLRVPSDRFADVTDWYVKTKKILK